MSVNPVLGKLVEEASKLETSLGYIMTFRHREVEREIWPLTVLFSYYPIYC